MFDKNLIFTGEDLKDNWFYNKYFYSGGNGRYFTFQIALNLVHQFWHNPVIIETGCQRQEDDIGAGMSTSIFAEYISRYGGKLITVDNDERHLQVAKSIVYKSCPNINAEFHLSDSVEFLSQFNSQCSLLYLDSFDYPYVEILNEYYGGRDDWDEAVRYARSMSREEFLNRHLNQIEACQLHTVKEFEAFIDNNDYLNEKTLLLIDDSFFAGGGKSRLLKEELIRYDWTCLIDFQQSLWIRGEEV